MIFVISMGLIGCGVLSGICIKIYNKRKTTEISVDYDKLVDV
jgi:hypothetical protein